MSSSSHFPQYAAPLPSPAISQHAQHFNFPPPPQRTTSAPQSQDSGTKQPQQAHQGSAPQTAETSQHAQQSQKQPEYDAATARGGPNDTTATSPFLKDLNLVSEAAKRAQMAVLMRDLGDVAL